MNGVSNIDVIQQYFSNPPGTTNVPIIATRVHSMTYFTIHSLLKSLIISKTISISYNTYTVHMYLCIGINTFISPLSFTNPTNSLFDVNISISI